MPGMTDRLPTAFAGFPLFEPGHVWLAGAGPGDPGLLTLHAFAGLAEADVVVHDALVDTRVLALAHPGATLEFAGKRGGKPSPSQGNITDRLIALARANLRVLRLKGGDPCVFGRGGEEALALAAAGVPFRIIPGVTSGLAALPEERILISELHRVAAETRALAFEAPAIIAIGAIVKVRAKLLDLAARVPEMVV